MKKEEKGISLKQLANLIVSRLDDLKLSAAEEQSCRPSTTLKSASSVLAFFMHDFHLSVSGHESDYASTSNNCLF